MFEYVKDTAFELRQNIIDAADEALKHEQYITLVQLFDALDVVTDLYIHITRAEYEQRIKDLEKGSYKSVEYDEENEELMIPKDQFEHFNKSIRKGKQ